MSVLSQEQIPRSILKDLKHLALRDICLNSRIKKEKLRELVTKWGLDFSEIVYMGDDIPDFEVMKIVGVPVCPFDADSEIKQIASYISDKKGGEGCVRDIIEQVLRLHNNWMDYEAFSW